MDNDKQQGELLDSHEGMKRCGRRDQCRNPQALPGGWLPATSDFFAKHTKATGEDEFQSWCKVDAAAYGPLRKKGFRLSNRKKYATSRELPPPDGNLGAREFWYSTTVAAFTGETNGAVNNHLRLGRFRGQKIGKHWVLERAGFLAYCDWVEDKNERRTQMQREDVSKIVHSTQAIATSEDAKDIIRLLLEQFELAMKGTCGGGMAYDEGWQAWIPGDLHAALEMARELIQP